MSGTGSSINWVTLRPTTIHPLPLPNEKFLLSVKSVSVSIGPVPTSGQPTPAPLTATGLVHASNQRIVFIANDANLAPHQGEYGVLRSWSIPFDHVLDGRLNQPWFGATNYEAMIVSNNPTGGLTHGMFYNIKIYFNEAGGGQFFEVVSEVRDRLAIIRRAEGVAMEALIGAPIQHEDLPEYTPPSPDAANPNPPTGSASGTSSAGAQPPLPSEEELAAVRAARALEVAQAEASRPPRGPPGIGAGEVPPEYET